MISQKKKCKSKNKSIATNKEIYFVKNLDYFLFWLQNCIPGDEVNIQLTKAKNMYMYS